MVLYVTCQFWCYFHLLCVFCQRDTKFGYGGRVATFWESAAHSVLVISHFGFEGGISDLIVSVPGHCLPLTLKTETHTVDKHIFSFAFVLTRLSENG